MSVRFVIDLLDFVRKAGRHHGKIPLSDLSRIQDFLYENKGEVFYWINGIIDQEDKHCLHIQVEGELCLCCQRCLGSLPHTLDIKTSLLVVENESELIQTDTDDSVDAILATVDMDVLKLVEDEIILSLSISSRHNEGECEIHKPEYYQPTEISSSKKNPFAVLKTLKKTQH